MDLSQRHVLVEAPKDAVYVHPEVEELSRHSMCAGGRVLVLEPPGVGHQGDIEGLGDPRRDLDAQIVDQPVNDLGRARGLTHDEVRGAEASVVVVVVDVEDVRVVAAEEVDRHPVDVSAVEKDDRSLVGVIWKLVHDFFERKMAILVRKWTLGGRHEHHRVLAQLLEDLVHREERSERVPVGILVCRQQELLTEQQLGDDLFSMRGCIGLAQDSRSPRRSNSEMRMPRSALSSYSNSSCGVCFRRSSAATRL